MWAAKQPLVLAPLFEVQVYERVCGLLFVAENWSGVGFIPTAAVHVQDLAVAERLRLRAWILQRLDVIRSKCSRSACARGGLARTDLFEKFCGDVNPVVVLKSQGDSATSRQP